jgi:hypothetical protein
LDVPYYLVKCRNQQERSEKKSAAEVRKAEEAFFRSPAWSFVDKESVGSAKLQQRLSLLLAQRLQTELPKV